jgi:hypothetical protein
VSERLKLALAERLFAETRRLERLSEHCALKLWINRSRLKAWNKWNAERRRSRRVRKAFKRWSQGFSTKALNTWKSWVRETQRVRAVSLKVLGRWRHKTFSLCWDYWRTFLARSKRLRHVSRGIVLRMTHKELMKCWNSWRRKQRLTGIATAVVDRWANNCIYAAWEAWILKLADIKRLKTVAKRVTARMQNICLAKAYNKIGEEVARSRKARKVITRWQRGTLLQSYDRWKYEMEVSRKQQLTMSRVLKKWTNQALTAAWIQWEYDMEVSRKQRLTMSRVLKKWTNQALTAAWIQWEYDMEVSRKQRLTMSRILKKWTNQALTAAWIQWKYEIEVSRKQRLTMSRILKKWTNQALTAALMQWQCRVNDMKRLRALLVKISQRWAHMSLVKALSKWMKAIWAHPTVLKMRLDLDFDPTLAPLKDKAAIEDQLCLDIGVCLGVDDGQIHVLCHHKGCVAAVLSQSESEEFAQNFTEAVRNQERVLLDSPVGKRVADAEVYGPICREALAMLMMAKNTDEEQRVNLEHLLKMQEEKRSTRNLRLATRTFINCSTSWALRKWIAWVRMRRHMRTVQHKIQQYTERHAICRAWFAMVHFREYMIGLKKYIAVFDDDSMSGMMENECRMWEAVLGYHEAAENQLYLDQIRRLRQEEQAAKFRHLPKLQPLAGSGPSVFPFREYHHSVANPRKATPLLEALGSDPMSLVPGVERGKRSNTYTRLSNTRLSPPAVIRPYSSPEARMDLMAYSSPESRVDLMTCEEARCVNGWCWL